ncbi:MAG: Crp/Fnr family transcriptional regulator [Bacilli bacterium]|nr:Crp/Fnr family transcriptional regulator [Bacilli bacterium]
MNIQETLKNSFQIWNKLNENEKSELISASKVINFKKNEMLQSRDASCLGLIILKKGIIRAYLASDAGKEITLYKLLENDICLFSAGCIMKDINFDINLICEEDVELILIPTEKYNQILEKSTVISNYASDILSSRFSDTIWILEQFVFHSLDKRVANYLIEHIDDDNNLRITHEKIANELGSAREVISRMLKYFENESLIKLERNNIKVINLKKLNKVAES